MLEHKHVCCERAFEGKAAENMLRDRWGLDVEIYNHNNMIEEM